MLLLMGANAQQFRPLPLQYLVIILLGATPSLSMPFYDFLGNKWVLGKDGNDLPELDGKVALFSDFILLANEINHKCI